MTTHVFRYLGLLLLLWLPVSSFAFSCQDVTEIPTAECDALVDFYDSTNGDSWTVKTGWKQTNTPCEWHGVGCTSGHVTAISLYGNNVSGGLPDLNLPNLTHLYLPQNQLTGSIPRFSYLNNLSFLTLHSNNLTGEIPDLTQLSSLSTLNIASNQLCRSDSIDYGQWGTQVNAYPACFSCSNVTEIPQSECEALVALYDSTDGDNWTDNTGWKQTNTPCSWKGIVCTDATVTRLLLSQNNLSGSFPNLDQLPNLEYLIFANNNLSGAVPDFSGLPNLIKIWLYGSNTLAGSLENFNHLENLQELHISSCQLEGGLIDLQLPNLLQLNLAATGLEGDIPDFSGMPKLEGLTLGNNNLLTSVIPDFSYMPNLTAINFCMSQLTGTIPDFSNLPNLKSLGLCNNQLTGEIPNFSNLPKLETLTISTNNLTGQIPNFTDLPRLKYLQIAGNQLTGEIPNFDNLPNLLNLGVSDNQLTGEIPDLILPNLERLGVSSNQLTGNLPNLDASSKLKYLYINDNQFSGSIDNVISSHTETLFSIYIQNNQFTGSIPDFSQLPALNNLKFEGNQFCQSENIDYKTEKWTATHWDRTVAEYPICGTTEAFSCTNVTEIPQAECEVLVNIYNELDGDNWTNNAGWLQTNNPCTSWYNLGCKNGHVTDIALQSNNLAGTIPDLTPLTELETLPIGGNPNITGALPNLGAFSKLYHFSINGAGIVGTLSDSILGATNLRELALIGTSLTGELPDLSQLTNLEQLNLGQSKFTGAMPNLPSGMTLLNLADNQLCRDPETDYTGNDLSSIPLCDNDTFAKVLHLSGEDNTNDSSNYGHNGVAHNVTYVDGIKGKAFSFNGTDSYIQILDSNALDTDSSMTIGLWVKSGSLDNPAGDWFLSKWCSSSPHCGENNDRTHGDWVLRSGITGNGDSPDDIVFAIQDENGAAPYLKLNNAIPSGEWRYITVTFDKGLMVAYVNGEKVSENSTSVPHTSIEEYSTDDIFVGNVWSKTNPAYAFEGAIDELTIHNRAFTESEVKALYHKSMPVQTGCNGDIQLPDNLCQDLAAYFPLDGHPNDASGNGFDGTEYNVNYGGGVIGQALRLDGMGYIRKENLNFSAEDFSISIWAYADKVPDNTWGRHLFALHSGANGRNQGDKTIRLGWLPNTEIHPTLTTIDNHDGSIITRPVSTIANGKWQHLTFVRDAGGLQTLYVDGINVASVTEKNVDAQFILQNGLLEIGAPNYYEGGWEHENRQTKWQGLLDELYIFKRQLTAEEIAKLYDSTKPLEFSCNQVTEIPQAECEALTAFYDSTDGDNWANNTNWKQTDTPCNWYGVNCNNGRVRGLYLSENKLSGEISDLSAFTELQNFSVYNDEVTGDNNNNLTGTLPDISQLTKLSTFRIERNNLSGTLPSISHLQDLFDFRVGQNHFTGSLPDLTGLTNLTYFSAGGNAFTGSLPSINGLSALKVFYAHYNQITGQISEFNDVPNLESYHVSNNQLTGSIPDLTNLTSLTAIDLSENDGLTGEIPNLSALTNLTTLELPAGVCRNPDYDYSSYASSNPECDFSCSSVTQIPTNQCQALVDFYYSTNGENWTRSDNWLETDTPCDWYGTRCEGGLLKGINLNNNNLTGTVSDISALTDLTGLYLHQNQLTGDLPDWSQLINLQTIYLQFNQFSGEIPSFAGLNRLMNIILYSNNLTGTLPDISHLAQLVNLQVQQNNLSGTLPQVDSFDHLIHFIANNNQFTGEIPSITGMNKLQHFEVGNNLLIGLLPTLDNFQLIKFAAYGNQLTGNIPEFGNVPKLQNYNVANNNLTGSLPDSLRNVTSLMQLHIGRNNLTGNLSVIEDLENLKFIHLYENNFEGGIPSLIKLTRLEDVVMRDSNLNGEIPEINHLTRVWRLWLGSNYLTGEIPAMDQLTLLTTFNFDSKPNEVCYSPHINYGKHTAEIQNRYPVCGEILVTCEDITEIPPEECNALQQLYTNTNGESWINNDWFTSEYACGWYGVSCENGRVTALDLDNNNLVGTLPAELEELTEMGVLSASGNKLDGSIPNLNLLANLDTLDLSNNELTGTIPNLDNLVNLRHADLSDNKLTGQFPSLEGLDSLENLYLDGNNLVGNIPNPADAPNLRTVKIDENPEACRNTEFDYSRFPQFASYPICTPSLLSIFITGTGEGLVQSGDNQIQCETQCEQEYATDEEVTLTAIPVAGSVFKHWTGACQGSESVTTVNMQHSRLCKAVFDLKIEKNQYLVTASKLGQGTGRIRAVTLPERRESLLCDYGCDELISVPHFKQSTIKISATAAKGSVFTGWFGDCNGTEETLSITLDSDISCEATFELILPPEEGHFTLQVITDDGTGKGTVITDSRWVGGINCGHDCMNIYPENRIVTLTAKPDEFSSFYAWGGDCEGYRTTINFKMDGNKQCIAIFTDDFIIEADKMTENLYEDGVLSTGEDINIVYPAEYNDRRFDEAFYLAQPALRLIDLQIDRNNLKGTWPDQLDNIPLGLKGAKVKEIKVMDDEYIAVIVELFNNNLDKEEVIPLIIHYGETPPDMNHVEGRAIRWRFFKWVFFFIK